MATRKDENDRLRDGTLPSHPGVDAVAMQPDSPARRRALQWASPNGEPIPYPHDLHAEVTLLAAVLWCGVYQPKTQTVSLVADLVDARMFILKPHQIIWRSLVELRKREAPTDPTTVHSEIVRARQEKDLGGMQYLDDLVASALQANDVKLREYADAIREAAMRRHLMQIATELHQQACGSTGLASDVAAAVATRLNDLAGLSARDASYVHVATPLARTMEKARKPGTDVALKTGFAKLDNDLLLGGLRRRQVSILAARTSVGKSALAIEIAMNANEANPADAVLYISLEMPEDEFTDRMVSSRSNVDLGRIMQGICDKDEIGRMTEAARRLRTCDIYFNVKQSLTMMQIRGIHTKLSRSLAKKGRRVGLVVVDHVGLVTPSQRKPNREQEVAEISREARLFANDNDCHLMMLVQISREAEKQDKSKMPKLHQLRESGALEQDANNVLILHREKDPATEQFVPNKPAILKLAKARQAKTGRIFLAVDPAFMKFTPWEDSDQAKARAPTPNSRQYVDTVPEPPPGRFDEDDNPLTAGL